MAGFAIVTMIVSCASSFALGAESDNPLEYLQTTYNVKVTYQGQDVVFGNLRVEALTNGEHIDPYLRALADECKKYPADFFTRARVPEIILCGSLSMGKAQLDGLFREQQRKLYVRFRWSPLGSLSSESFHSFHHELGHAVQSAVWGDGHYDWQEWAALNPSGFKYGRNVSQALLADPEKKWGTWSTNQPGFFNAYSATAPWEDRSEIMGALMNDGDRLILRRFCQQDPIILKKVELMSKLLSKLCGAGQTNYFWDQALVSLKTETEIIVQSNKSQFTAWH